LGALVDLGANGSLSGSDVRFIETSFRRASVTGIGDHTIQGLTIALIAAFIQTKPGYITGMFQQYAHIGKGRSIHSASPMGVIVDDNP
jgi:hypothetical protein